MILTSKLQNNICKNRLKTSRYRKECRIFARIFKSPQSACCLLSIIVCNTTKIATSRVKNPFKNGAKNGQCDQCKDVPFSKTTIIHQWRRQFFQIRSIQPKKAGWCQFDNLTLSPLVFPKMNFLEERQSPAFSDFFKRYDGLLLQL